MIKANELRLGNWVLEVDEFSRIYSLDSGGTTFWKINDINVHKETLRVLETHEQRFKSIELSMSLLVNSCGFAKNGFGCRLYLNNTDELFYGTQDNVLRYQTRGSGFTRNFDIKYLHQLQNLFFSLTGKELEVAIK